jgi:RNA polymerase sigma factor (sigma-70 family)
MARTRNLPAYRHYRVLFEVGSFSGLTDGELLARFVSREEQSAELAFTAIVERHAAKVLHICRAVVRNEHDAEDAFQATFLVLAAKAGKLQARESLGPWLFAVARRVAAGARARALGREARERRAAGDRAKRPHPDPIDDDVSAVLYEEIDRLPERYRLPLVLCDLESQSHQEAARRLGWPLGTVKSRQARGRQRLRARLTRRGVSGTLGGLGAACAARSARAAVPASLIESTARTAADFITSGATGRVVSASVSTLVTNTLRAMIMLRMSTVMGVLLTVSVGLVATVLAQTTPKPASPSNKFTSNGFSQNPDPNARPATASFEYEVRIWKDGAPVTPTMKMRAHPGETSQIKIPDGTLEVRFQPLRDSAGPTLGVTQSALPVTRPSDASQNLAALGLLKSLQSQTSNSELGKAAEKLSRLMGLGAINSSDSSTALQRLAELSAVRAKQDQLDHIAPAENNHEQRLREIERKLEKILSALDRLPAQGREEANEPRQGNDPRPK